LYANETSDRFVVGGTALRYESADGAAWELLAEQILCIGESTSESGPADEDWHLCFVTNAHGSWVEGSLKAQSRNDALQWLSVRLGCSLELKLVNSPAFRSRVMWPTPLLDQSLFDYQVAGLRRMFSRTARQLGFAPLRAVQSVRPAVLEKLWSARRNILSRSA
jgi:hypothetical protein